MKKSIIILVSIILAYLLFAIYGIEFISLLTKKYVYIDKNVKWVYSSGKWKTIDKNDTINLKNYALYNPYTNELNRANMKFEKDTWYIKDNGKYIAYDYPLFAYKAMNFKIYSFTKQYTNMDTDIINKVLSYSGISSYGELSLNEKIVIDLDNDGNDEIIYSISNMYSEAIENQYFSLVAVVSNNDISIIKSNVLMSNDIDKVINNQVYAIIDYNNDKKLELIISGERFSNIGNEYSLYENQNDKYIEVISTK